MADTVAQKDQKVEEKKESKKVKEDVVEDDPVENGDSDKDDGDSDEKIEVTPPPPPKKRSHRKRPAPKAAPKEKNSPEKLPISTEEEEIDSPIEETATGTPKVGTLEQPITELARGSRERKKVERLAMDVPEKQKLDIQDGEGTKFSNIPWTYHQIMYIVKPDKLKALHRVVYGKIVTANEVKKNLLNFSGFNFDKDSEEFQKRFETAMKFSLADLKLMCQILDLEKNGVKNDIATRVTNFLHTPESTGKTPTKLRKRKTSGKKSSKKRPAASRSLRQKKKSSSEQSEDAEAEPDNEGEIEEEEEKIEPEDKDKDEADDEDYVSTHLSESKSEHTESDSGNDDSADEDYGGKKKRTPAKRKAKRSPKKAAVRKSPIKRKKVVAPLDSESSTSDDEPLAKKAKKPLPTDDEIVDKLKEILKDADLEEVTMKKVINELNESYVDIDLSSRRDFIKATVKTLI